MSQTMPKTERFVLRVDVAEKEMIGELAKQLERNRSDAVRLLIRESASALGIRTQHAGDTARSAGIHLGENIILTIN